MKQLKKAVDMLILFIGISVSYIFSNNIDVEASSIIKENVSDVSIRQQIDSKEQKIENLSSNMTDKKMMLTLIKRRVFQIV